MTQPFRLPTGGQIDRSRTLRFRFDGREYAGYAGDTLATALLACGVRITGRSFKYHRPRGIFAAGFEEPNALVQLGQGARTEPNLKATQIELVDGLEARAVNCSPSARWDWLSWMQWLKPLMPSGFYYKTFMAPSWQLYEGAIRRAAGLGRSPAQADPDFYDKRNTQCDVLVVGGGVSGIRAAMAARQRGADVLLLDAQLQISAPPDVRSLSRTTVFGAYDHHHFAAVERIADRAASSGARGPRQRLWKIRARELILATGAIERPLVFPNNDRPGVMLASAAREYLQRYAVIPGRRVAIATNNDSAYEVAEALRSVGVEIAAIADLRKGLAPTDVRGACGVKAVELHRIDDAGRALPGTRQVVQADALLVSGGFTPTAHLYSQAGGALRFDPAVRSFVPDRSLPRVSCVDAAAGEVPPAGPICEIDASAVGRNASRCWVDLAADVTSEDLRLALRENFRSVEHVKRYTTTGMMADQGKTSNVNAIGVIASALGARPHEVGTTKFRPPFDPVTLGAIAGRRVGAFYKPLRRLPAHDSHLALGAKLEDYGGWLRPAFYPRDGEDERAAVAREVLAVRNSAGLFDGSPLGKILVHGPDAGEFLHRMYLNNIRSLNVGQCRYGMMLGEDGIVSDDGICARLDASTYLVGTTSGAAGRIADSLEEWLQCEWVDLDVVVEQVTTQWAVSTITGPKAREVLARLGASIDLAPAAFPHMTVRAGTWHEQPIRIMRVSFTGEVSFEVSVPASSGRALWEALMRAGGAELTPFGIEAMMALRIEKGYLHVGTDTEGTTMPQDVGFGSIMAKKPEDFVGRRSTLTPEGRRGDRKQLVGLAAEDARTVLPVGAHIVGTDFNAAPYLTRGYVTSSVMSPTLARPVALALLADGRARAGEQVLVYDEGRLVRAKVVDTAAYDPKGERVHG